MGNCVIWPGAGYHAHPAVPLFPDQAGLAGARVRGSVCRALAIKLGRSAGRQEPGCRGQAHALLYRIRPAHPGTRLGTGFRFLGLSDHFITDRYFALLGEKLFPRLVRESRRYLGRANRGKPSARELELIMGLHGSIFYMGMRRWVYGHAVHDSKTEPFDEVFIHDRVRGYLRSLEAVATPGDVRVSRTAPGIEIVRPPAGPKSRLRSRSKPVEEISPWPMH